MRSTVAKVGFAALHLRGAVAAPDAIVPGEPNMTRLEERRSDSTGHDGAWYTAISNMSDHSDRPSAHINMRVTSPFAARPEVTHITGLSVITTDADGSDHSIVIRVTDPLNSESSCPVGVSPCLANGALTVEIDCEEALLAPGTVEVAAGVAVSAVNLPGACRSSDFNTYPEAMGEEQITASRKLSTVTGLQDMAYWILGDPTVNSLVECAEYVAGATASGEDALFAHDSELASFQIMIPGAVIRLSHGRRHQLSPRDPTNGLERPGHGAWEMLFALEHNGLSADTSGVLGGANRKPTVEAMQSLRETPEDYRVEGPLEIVFAQGKNHE